MKSFQQLDSTRGWVVANNRVLVTDSAGGQWQDITPARAAHIDGAFFLDHATAWVVLSDSLSGSIVKIARTQDGGSHWSTHTLAAAHMPEAGNYAHESSISFVDSEHGYVLLRAATSQNFSRGVLLSTENGGQTWTRLPDPPIADGLHFVTARFGWLTGGPAGDQLFLTRDGGVTWNISVVPVNAQAHAEFLQSPVFRDELHGTLAARLTTGDTSVAAVFTTQNGGRTWALGSLSSSAAGLGGLAKASPLFLQPQQTGGESAMNAVAATARAFVPGGEIVNADMMSNTEGWLHVQASRCAGFKTDCVQESHLLSLSGSTLKEITPKVISDSLQLSAPSPFASRTVSTHSGFDQCAAGTVGQMQTWWTSSPYFDSNIYIGGVSRACAQANLTASWVQSVFAQGWRLIPTWVGPQASCSTFTHKISSTPSTAFSQGVSEGNAAVTAANNLGLSGSIIYYDMENYNSSDSTCQNAVNQFISGWVQTLRSSGFSAGVYGSATNANSGWATIANVPDDVWIAKWDGRATTTGLTPLPDTLWSSNQRIHQYAGGHNETWGGLTFNIDNDIENGQVAAP